jgi:acetoacetyl-CoA synthetase
MPRAPVWPEMSTPFHEPGAETIAASAMTQFTAWCASRSGRTFSSYADLHAWSVSDMEAFWGALLSWSRAACSGSDKPAVDGDDVELARFFPNLRLSYTENLLASGAPDAAAVTACDETGRVETLSWAQLTDQVARFASGLRALGVEPGDRVVAVVRNAADSIVAALAVAGLGATWSSTAPDMGAAAILSRFSQLEPRWLIVHGAQRYGGQMVDLAPLSAELSASLPTLRGVIALDDPPDLEIPVHTRADIVNRGAETADDLLAGSWPHFPFDHPLFILFSSGTTGVPKCIVHGAGGTLLQHIKEHRLHTGLTPEDTLYFHTTTGWMMWNWLVSALAGGTHIVVYDGSVSFPTPDALIDLLARERVTVFGTSPVYLQFLELSGVDPALSADLSALRLVMSTGAVLYPRHYEYVRDHFGPLPVHSISGGTDIIGCFVLGNPNLPVHLGESPCAGLGFDIRVKAASLDTVGTGELVCCAPFISRPVAFFGDADGSRLHAAYYAENPGMWTHGDFVELTGHGSARILGRSDGILNIKGVRIGPAEIYGALHDVAEIQDCMALSAEDPEALGGRRLVLLVVAEGELERKIMWKIKRTLKQRCGVNHVPERLVVVPELPTTHSGKRSERAAQDTLDGRPVRNRDALRNPECLDAIMAAWRAI